MGRLRLFFIGIAMGIADLIPGVSGGTIAFISGIYEELLASIKTLQLQAIKKIAWPFLLTLGSGILTSILVFSKIFYFLLQNYKVPLCAFFFGLIAASALMCAQKAQIKNLKGFSALFCGFILSFLLTILPTTYFFGSSFFGIVCAGMLGTGAMLLPGISGSFLLQVIGVYPLVIYALAEPTAPGSIKLLLAMGIGISLGFIIFSRLISFLLSHFYKLTLSVLVGFMVGGLKALWPFSEGNYFFSIIFIAIGFLFVFLLEKLVKRSLSI